MRIASSNKIALLVFCLLCSSTLATQPNYSRLVVFGDSLSDTGNVFGTLLPNLTPPYYQNRISNGPLVVDHLAGELGLSTLAAGAGGDNYAVVGGNIVGTDVSDLSAQVTRFLVTSNGSLSANDLVFISIGGNDLRDLRSITDPGTAFQEIANMVTVLSAQMERLHEAGGVSFIVVNAPDIGRIPETLDRESSDPGVSARLSMYTIAFNEQLSQSLKSFVRRTGSSIYDFDVFNSLNSILDSPAAYGIWHTETGCFNFGQFSFHPDCEVPFFPLQEPRFERFAFFDVIHPTATTSAIVSADLSLRLAQPPIPVPNRLSAFLVSVLLLLEE